MKNKDMPAMPMFNECGAALHHSNAGLREGVTSGLTKREMMAMHAMQGILSNSGGVIQSNHVTGTGWCNSDAKCLAKWSIECADALLRELEK
ncbi:hypothetical protein NVP1233A_32 [Vibrio phage 1.233.A._10N.261.51.E6]|nr:hypothetical protein NVP1233A_32 [Vibrio phage 1.233.A._10N.261.51.E6]AUR96905.1 hypothetical protein NVP1233B_32 [Vibrio phage 1.233.B._10N.261.51.E6]